MREVRAIADEIGAKVLFDAAHQCGMIAGKTFPNPLAEGAHLMTMSTYKSLGGPAGGLIVTNDAEIAQRLDAIAYPGLTANFDAAKSAALAITLLDWREFGASYAQTMVATAQALAAALAAQGLRGLRRRQGFHPLASVRARRDPVRRRPGGEQEAAQGRLPRLRHRPAGHGRSTAT